MSWCTCNGVYHIMVAHKKAKAQFSLFIRKFSCLYSILYRSFRAIYINIYNILKFSWQSNRKKLYMYMVMRIDRAMEYIRAHWVCCSVFGSKFLCVSICIVIVVVVVFLFFFSFIFIQQLQLKKKDERKVARINHHMRTCYILSVVSVVCARRYGCRCSYAVWDIRKLEFIYIKKKILPYSYSKYSPLSMLPDGRLPAQIGNRRK